MNLVLTINVGQKYQEMADLTHPFIKKYAQKIGADFININKTNCSSPHWEKFQIFNLLNKYDRILYIDSDIVVREDSPNLFDLVPKSKLGAFNEFPFTQDRKISLIKACEDYNIVLPEWNGKYYNTGVMVISRTHKYLFKKPDQEIFNFYEQGYLNAIISKEKVSMYDLPYKFNRMTCMDRVTGEERFASYFIHYAGYPNLDMVLSIIKSDIVKLDEAKPDYKFQRHILLDVQGGLGDQICAEPTIRYLAKYVYPKEDIVIKTHFPRIFKHLNLPTFLHEDFKPNPGIGYYHVITLPGPETLTWSVVSNLLCHTVDYVSMAVLKRVLPNKDKALKLQVDIKDLANVIELVDYDLSKLILVHAGKHWESKTFPISWWQELIDKLDSQGFKVCLIGQDDDTRGVHDLKLTPNMIDLRNLLDLGSYFALISKAGLLISNDSSPIHVAGAFDTKVILIPSCKHPDHILHYRPKGQYYNAIALYKKLTLDDCNTAPTEVHGSSGEFVKGNFLDYLPTTDTVVSTARKMLNEKSIICS